MLSSYDLLSQLGIMSDDTRINRVDKLSNLRETIRKKLAKAHEKSENTYNTSAKPICYKVRQEIFRKNHSLNNFSKGINPKFNPKYIKCRVKQKIGNTLYGIEDMQGKYIGNFHASDLKP